MKHGKWLKTALLALLIAALALAQAGAMAQGNASAVRQCRSLTSKKALLPILPALPLQNMGVTLPPEETLVYDGGALFNPKGSEYSVYLASGSVRVEYRARHEQIDKLPWPGAPEYAEPWMHDMVSDEAAAEMGGMTMQEAVRKAEGIAAMLNLSLEERPFSALVCAPKDGQPFYCFTYVVLLDGLPLYARQFPNNGFVGNGTDVWLPFTVAFTKDRLLYLEAPLMDAFAAKGAPAPLLTEEEATERMRAALQKRYPGKGDMEMQSIHLCQFGFSQKGNSAYGYQVLPTWMFTFLKEYEGEGKHPNAEYLDAITGERQLWADTGE